MVLTNLEFWAADGSSSLPATALEFETNGHIQRHNNPFDPRSVPTRNMTHLSSNDIANNNTLAHDFMANDVNNIGQTATAQQQHLYANFIGNNNNNLNTNVVGVNGTAASRCKKRFFVLNGNDADADEDDNNRSFCTNAPAKRCRFDDDFAAQYCNDFFSSLPAATPQICTQSCLMDTEEVTVQQQTVAAPPQQQQQLHQQQQIVDEAMYENNNNNIYNFNNNNVEKYEQSILHLQLQHQQQQQHHQQSQMPTQQPPTLQQQQQQPQTQEQQQQQPHQYHHHHQQQHYQEGMIIITPKICQQENRQHDHDRYNKQFIYSQNHNSHKRAVVEYEQKMQTMQNLIQQNFEDEIDDATLFEQLHGGCLHHFCQIPPQRNTTRKNIQTQFEVNKKMMTLVDKDLVSMEEF
ncbi:uncharacterized protein isoform X2 [Musca autumnalis]|uniref:uncharacterized protein isoform X2 n=1 Tax=Musca autumnalis TaxID=221902 RepID=UPI003CF56314